MDKIDKQLWWLFDIPWNPLRWQLTIDFFHLIT